jgi:hypothetical protein
MVAAMALAAASTGAPAACIALSPAEPGAPALALIALDDRAPAFRITYIHSVTHTPVEERYVVDGDRIVETEIRFVEHGPGLPTEADAGGTFEHRDGAFVVRGRREFERIVMRVDAAQTPSLSTAARSVDLARWGHRAVALTVRAAGCDAR